MGLIQAISPGPVCLDTALFIYYIEEDARYIDLLEPLFKAIDQGYLPSVTSGITLLETLVVPFRTKDRALALAYEQILTESRGIQLIDLSPSLLRQAAELRAVYSLKTPDALQVACALQEKCGTFITNDRRLPKINGLAILQLSDYTRSKYEHIS